ncbi:hypothetical protein RRG08_016159 [Elysia crispata]|uniref:Uncharacterized protein n=1 Tax=Elysia crispata TaxID=231223 RepID=A0AAE0Z4L0_9GAST|nr:hypothetical protein RRG08_016159 [Elysia crispata]
MASPESHNNFPYVYLTTQRFRAALDQGSPVQHQMVCSGQWRCCTPLSPVSLVTTKKKSPTTPVRGCKHLLTNHKDQLLLCLLEIEMSFSEYRSKGLVTNPNLRVDTTCDTTGRNITRYEIEMTTLLSRYPVFSAWEGNVPTVFIAEKSVETSQGLGHEMETFTAT